MLNLKKNKKSITGIIALFLVLFVVSYALGKVFENWFYSEYPEIRIIRKEIREKFSKGRVSVVINTLQSENGSTTNVNVGYQSKERLSDRQVIQMGRKVCEILKSQNKDYDNVSIINRVSFLPVEIPYLHFTATYSESAACSEWEELKSL